MTFAHKPDTRTGDIAPWAALAIMMALYVVFFIWLSLTRHNAFQTNALDLGYITHATWNTARGDPFRFSTFEGALYQLDIPVQEIRHPDILLAYHVEPLLVLIAPLFWLWPDARALLVMQTAGLAAAALPVYMLARRRLKYPWLGLVFPALYLMAPSIQAANLSDFHTVAFSPVFLIGAYLALENRNWKLFSLLALLSILCREEVALPVAMLGLYAALSQRPRHLGVVTAVFAACWFGLSTQVIMPAFNGLGHSPFLTRYNQFGTSLGEVLTTVLQWPSPLLQWFFRGDVLRYALLLAGMGGGIVLLGYQGWLLAFPIIAANSLSNYPWMHSGGGHYTASVTGLLMIGAIEGTFRLYRWWFQSDRPRTIVALCVLAVGAATHWWVGISPPARNWNAPIVTSHDRIAHSLLAKIPPDADVIAQSALYPHLATRPRSILFPSQSEADIIALDVTSTTYPWSMRKYERAVADVVNRPGFRVKAAQNGVIILERGHGEGVSLASPEFTSFALTDTEPRYPSHVAFEGGLILEGYTLSHPVEVNTGPLPWEITTYWRASRPQPQAYRPVLFFRRPDGALGWAYDEGTATDIWFPTTLWPLETRIQMNFPPLDLGEFTDVLIGVISRSGDPWSIPDRLTVVDRATASALDQDTLVPLFDLSQLY